MWSLPDINVMNARAAAEASKLKKSKVPRGTACEVYRCGNKATQKEMYFDIFSEDPKGCCYTCSEHNADEIGDDSYFRCCTCNRLMIDHYTWERYCTSHPDGYQCLACAASEYFGDGDNWIEPSEVKSLADEPSRLTPVFCRATGVFNHFGCKHVLGVKQPVPEGYRFVDNCEFDNTTGQQISGDDVLDIIRKIDKPFIAVMDAAYQFAVSIGFYVKE